VSDPKTILAQVNPHAILLEGHDEAIVGIVWLPDQLRPVALYDDTRLAESIVSQNLDWTMDDAYEWIDANVPVGADAPAVVEVMADAEELAEELDDATDWC
jgi:hypothetical protein